MATTENLINGDGTTTQFSFSFPYIKPEDVRVELQEIDSTKPIIEQIISTTAVTLFTIPSNNPTLIQFNSLSAATNYQAITGAPLANHAVNTGNTIKIRIYRSTSSDQTPATFFSGGAIRSQDLNANFDSILYINQEKENQLNQVIAGGIADGSITTAKLADNAVTTAKLADGAVTTSNYTYPGGVQQTVQDRLEQSISVIDFGAVGDGVNDDTAAIQACFDYAKAQFSLSTYANTFTDPYTSQQATTNQQHRSQCIKVVFPPGKSYRITNTINLTDWRWSHSAWYVEARGALFMLEMAGKPAFDLLKSRKCIWYGGNFTSVGNPVAAQATLVKCVFQLGRDSVGQAADSHRFTAIDIKGYYSWACIYNYCSEDVYFDGVNLKNDWNNSNSYCLIQDSHNIWEVTSEFVTDPVKYAVASFLRNTFIRCDFRKQFSGGAVWMGSACVYHQFIASYLVATCPAASPLTRLVTLYASPSTTNPTSIGSEFSNNLFDLHVETDLGDLDPATGLDTCFYLTGELPVGDVVGPRTATLSNFTFQDRNTHCQKYIFERDTAIFDEVVIRACDIKTKVGRDVGQVIFDIPAKYTVSGKIVNLTDLSGKDPAGRLFGLEAANFSGEYYCKDADAGQSTNPLSSYRVFATDTTAYVGSDTYISKPNGRTSLSFYDVSTYNPSATNAEIVIELNPGSNQLSFRLDDGTGTLLDEYVFNSSALYSSVTTPTNLGLNSSPWERLYVNQVYIKDSGTGGNGILTVVNNQLLFNGTVIS